MMKKTLKLLFHVIVASLLIGIPLGCEPVEAHSSQNQETDQEGNPEDGTSQEDTSTPEKPSDPDQPDTASTLIQRIQEKTPSILEVTASSTVSPFEGISLTEASLVMDSPFGKMKNHLFVVEVHLGDGFTLRPSSPDDQPFNGNQQDMLEQAQNAESRGHKVYAAINGDFYGGYGNLGYNVPRGVHYVDGKNYTVSTRSENVLYVLNDGKVILDRTANFLMKDLTSVRHAIGASHTLVWNGKIEDKSRYQKNEGEWNILSGLHPRTFIGLSKDGKTAWLFVVDGRQEFYSAGIAIEDMSDICLGAGCYRACNMDGGGSTTLVFRKESDQGTTFQLLNKPSDSGIPRKVVNGLLVIAK